MEPLHPQVREALKQAHPGLTDEDIDRIDELTMRRFELDPEKEADSLEALESERDKLIREKMPRYQEIVRAFSVASPTRQRETPRVEVKPQSNDDS